jgi:solute carrier family 8 (sodium/calcium exchanger)
MEYHGFVRCMEYLLGTGLLIKTFVSDGNSGIAKYMREKLTTIKHYFDIWHLKKSMLSE